MLRRVLQLRSLTNLSSVGPLLARSRHRSIFHQHDNVRQWKSYKCQILFDWFFHCRPLSFATILQMFWAVASFSGNFHTTWGTHKYSIHTRVSLLVALRTGNLASEAILCHTSASCSRTSDHSNRGLPRISCKRSAHNIRNPCAPPFSYGARSQIWLPFHPKDRCKIQPSGPWCPSRIGARQGYTNHPGPSSWLLRGIVLSIHDLASHFNSDFDSLQTVQIH